MRILYSLHVALVGLLLVASMLPVTAWSESSSTRSSIVNCDKGDSLSVAIRRASAGQTLRIKGTCYESVKVGKRLKLVGIDGAIIDGSHAGSQLDGVIKVVGANRVRIRDLTVRNGQDQGIVIENNAVVVIENVVTHSHATSGLSVDASYVELAGIESYGNGAGFDFFTHATVIAKGNISAHDNAGPGVAINANSILELRGSIVDTRNNRGDGVTLVNDSQLVVLSFPEAQGSGVVAVANGGAAGMFIANSSLSVVGSNTFGSGANAFQVMGHGVGILLIASNFSVPFATAKFEVANNGVGILFTDNSDGFVVGGLDIHDNGVGLLGDGAGVLRIRNADENPSRIANNASLDVLMNFGTRIELDPAIEHLSFVCDPSVLTAPEGVSCP